MLELACGTGIWTKELSRYAHSIHVVDSSPEVLEICRGKVDCPRFSADCGDLFEWEPLRHYDFVFFSFWLSHVPPARFPAFWKKVGAALRPGGTAFFVDSAVHSGAPVDQEPRPDGEWVARRDLADGREFEIVKIYYQPERLRASLEALGWSADVRKTREFFVYGSASQLDSELPDSRGG